MTPGLATLPQVEKTVRFRHTPAAEDRQQIKRILESTGFFFPFEIDVAMEVVEDYLNLREKSGYHFLFAEESGKTVGYVCYGPIAMAAPDRFEIFWIGVDQAHRKQGIGKLLMQEAEKLIQQLGGRYIYVETSSRAIYESTRQFYLRLAYDIVARIPQYYGDNDDQVVFLKEFPR